MTLEAILTNTFPEKIDVHHYEDKIKGQELLLEKAIMRDDNKQAIHDFISFCKADPKVGGSRIRLYLYTLRNIGIWTGDKSFKNMDKKDIVNLVTRIKEHKFVSKKRLFYINLDCKKNDVSEAEQSQLIQDVLEKEGVHYSLWKRILR